MKTHKEVFPKSLGYQSERENVIIFSWLINSVAKGLFGGIVFATSTQSVWEDLKERFDHVGGSRIFNLHKEIVTLNQGIASVAVYYSRLKDLWEEFEALVPSPKCTCEKSVEYVQFLQKQKLFQFFGAE